MITYDAELNENKLIDYEKMITFYDKDGNEIDNASYLGKRKSVLLSDLNENTINAFLCSEDRKFYSHNGLNYKRILKAVYKNVSSKSFKEGASTISQQLIKNTHLTNDKTLKRKLKEIKLTRQLEKRYTKNQILEMYLNTIYFGHNCYGLQSAANFYYNKQASELNLEQSATIVGLLTSPNNYSPFKNPEKCIKRRNIVLKNMFDCDVISESEYRYNIALPLSATKTTQKDGNSDYYFEVFNELEDKLNKDIFNKSRLHIYTYLDTEMQNYLESLDFEHDNSIIITNNLGGVSAFKSNIGLIRRQPGSTIKPLLVYAPAIDTNQISLFTQIEDKKIDHGGYSPENYDKKYHGYVTVKDSIAKSYNVPAVEILNTIHLNTAIKYANKLNIYPDKQDENLSLALGGMKYGTTIKEICDGYTTFANDGNFINSHFIKEIKDENGKTIYKDQVKNKKVFNSSTCSLINDALIETARTGTAKLLNETPYDVAAKTGTCGTEEGNTDAYCICYTSSHTIGVWLGSKDNKKISVTGGKNCTKYVKNILNELYKDSTPSILETKKDTKDIFIDRREYETNHKIMLADDISPLSGKMQVKCSIENLPKEKSNFYSYPQTAKPSIVLLNNTIYIQLCQTEYYSYIIKRDNFVIYDGKFKESIEDTPPKGNHVYSVTPYYFDGKIKHFGKTISLPPINISSNEQINIPDIAYKDWTNS